MSKTIRRHQPLKGLLGFVLNLVLQGMLCLFFCVGIQAGQADRPSEKGKARTPASIAKKRAGKSLKKESYTNAGLKDLIRIDLHYLANGRLRGVYVVQPGYSEEASDERRYIFTATLSGQQLKVSFEEKQLPYPIAEGGKDDSQGKAVWTISQKKGEGKYIVLQTFGRNYEKRAWESYDMEFEMTKL